MTSYRKMHVIFFVQTFFVVILFSSGCSWDKMSSGARLSPLKARVGEEILFYAQDFASISSADVPDPMHARYRWFFGDTMAPVVESRSATYTFASAGEYDVTLEVTPAVFLNEGASSSTDDDDNWIFRDRDIKKYVRKCVVAGQSVKLMPHVLTPPVLLIPFDGSIDDLSPQPHILNWKNNKKGSYAAGLSGKALDLSGGRALVVTDDTLFGERSEFTISFRARRKDHTLVDNCILWQPTANALQPAVRFLISETPSGSLLKESVSVYTMSNTPTKTEQFNFENDTNWHYYAFSYSASMQTACLYRDGVKVQEKAVSGNIKTPSGQLYIGYGEITSGGVVKQYSFNGIIDDLRVYDHALTEGQLVRDFCVRHADFHGHLAQYIVVTVPESVMNNPLNRLYATLCGGALASPAVIADKTALNAEERFIFRQSSLEGSENEYILTVQLRDATDSVLFENSDFFVKAYDGIPKVGIDENNAIRLNGELFFPVTPWGLGGTSLGVYPAVDEWIDNGYINSLYGQGFWPDEWNIPGYKDYLDHALLRLATVIGPATHWDGQGNSLNYGSSTYAFGRCTDAGMARSYVDALKGHDAMMMWQWGDEPELNNINSSLVRSLTLVSHQRDGQHLVATNMMGHPYGYTNVSGSFWYGERHTYALGFNRNIFGVERPVTDVLGIDYYPLDAVRSDVTDTMNRMGVILDTIREENLDLVPVMSYVETADAGAGSGTDLYTPWMPSPEQLKMIVWFNVVHEAKGINWFHYFLGTPAENLAYLSVFVRQITELTPVVLGPRTSRTILSNSAGNDPGRVDSMLREYNGKLYLIAVRVSEFAYQSSDVKTTPAPAQNYPVEVTFSISGVVGSLARVYDEERSITVTNGAFADSFAPYAVHIYVIE